MMDPINDIAAGPRPRRSAKYMMRARRMRRLLEIDAPPEVVCVEARLILIAQHGSARGAISAWVRDEVLVAADRLGWRVRVWLYALRHRVSTQAAGEILAERELSEAR